MADGTTNPLHMGSLVNQPVTRAGWLEHFAGVLTAYLLHKLVRPCGRDCSLLMHKINSHGLAVQTPISPGPGWSTGNR